MALEGQCDRTQREWTSFQKMKHHAWHLSLLLQKARQTVLGYYRQPSNQGYFCPINAAGIWDCRECTQAHQTGSLRADTFEDGLCLIRRLGSFNQGIYLSSKGGCVSLALALGITRYLVGDAQKKTKCELCAPARHLHEMSRPMVWTPFSTRFQVQWYTIFQQGPFQWYTEGWGEAQRFLQLHRWMRKGLRTL